MFIIHPPYNAQQPTIQTYHPTNPSPLSSSPLRSSPPREALSPRSANLSTGSTWVNDSGYEDGDSIMSSPPEKIFTYVPPKTPALMDSPSRTRDARRRNGGSGSGSTSPHTATSVSGMSSSGGKSGSFSKRTIKVNPLLHNKGSESEGRETRRKLFLKKVKEGAEEKRWQARGGEDEMMRTIWVMEERRRVAGLRAMSEWERRDEAYLCLDEVVAEEVVGWEERELEEIIREEERRREMEGDGGMEEGGRGDGNETPYGSDEEEYDSIFMDVIQEEMRMSSQQEQPQSQLSAEDDMMDMS